MMSRLHGLLVALALLVASACSSETASFREHDVSFEYPGDWRRIDPPPSTIAQAGPRWIAAVGVGGANLVSVGAYQLAFPVTEANFEQFDDDFTNRLTNVARDAGGRLVEEAETATLGGLPGFKFRLSGDNGATRVIVAFAGTTEYILECRSTQQLRDQIDQGCDQIIESFEWSRD